MTKTNTPEIYVTQKSIKDLKFVWLQFRLHVVAKHGV